MALTPILIRSKPGIKRDGTLLDSEYYVDGQWVRFQRQLPRKIRGYTTTNRFSTQITRSMKTFALDEYTYIFLGAPTLLEYLSMDLAGNTTVILNRTPTTLTQNDLNLWQFDIITDSINIPPVNLAITQVAPNGKSITSTKEGQLFYGSITDTSLSGTPLTEFTWALSSQYLSASGGLVALFPYLVVFGNAGSVAWSAPNRPTRFNSFEFAAASGVLTTASSPQGAFYVLVAATQTLIFAGDLIAFSASDSAPYYGVSNVGTVSSSAVTLTAGISAAYLAGSSIFQSVNYPAITLAVAVNIGATSFLVFEDRAEFFNAFPNARLFFDGVAGEVTFVSAIYDSVATRTIVTTTAFTAAQGIGLALNRLENLGYILSQSTVANATMFTSIGPAGSAFPAGLRVTFGLYTNPFSVVASATTTLVPAITLVNPLLAPVPSGTQVYLQGSTTAVSTGAGNARVASQKIVQGVALRGGAGNSPSALLWSIDALLRMTFVGGEQVFQFDTISPASSILAANSVIEFDGVYYWIGSDRFLIFNGVVRELPNDLNINWFFDNLNRAWANRVFAFKVPRYSEIWWCFPFGDSQECNYAIIYNIRENTWYDTKLPGSGRSAGEFMSTFGKPLLAGVDLLTTTTKVNQTLPLPPIVTTTSGYRLWQHEVGVDEIDGTQVYPVESYFETAPFSLITQPQGKLKSLRIALVEPDFVQSGTMEMTIVGQANARAGIVTSNLRAFPETITVSSDQVVMTKDERRILRFRFRSNVFGGDYQLGKIVAHVEETDGTFLGAVSDTSY